MERKKEAGEERIENFIEDVTVQKRTRVGSTTDKPTVEDKIAKEPVYRGKELAACAEKLFGSRQECVMAALMVAGKEECTVSEARELVGEFLGRDVG